jgi:hypothetical protein
MKLNYKTAGVIIAGLNLLAILNSAWFFLVIARFPVLTWLCFNACAPSVVIFLAGFLFQSRMLMAASLPFLFYFGGGGLFVFGWQGTSLIAQAGHILMVVACIYIIAEITKAKAWKKAIYGLLAGIIAFAVLMPLQNRFVKNHPEYLKKLGDPKFEKVIKKN